MTLHRQANTRPGPIVEYLDPAELREAPDLIELFRKSAARPSLLDRFAAWLVSERAFYLYVGIYAGCFLTVGLAAVWERFR